MDSQSVPIQTLLSINSSMLGYRFLINLLSVVKIAKDNNCVALFHPEFYLN